MFPEGLTLTGILDGGAVGLLGFLVLMVFFGKLRPASAFTELREDANARVQEVRDTATSWREAYEIEAASRQQQEATLAQMAEVVHTTQAMVNAVRDAGAQTKGGDREEPVSPSG